MIREARNIAKQIIKINAVLVFFGLVYVFSNSVFAETLTWVNLNDDDFKDKVRSFTRKGYMPIDFEVITNTTSRTYALVMEKPLRRKKTILRSQLEESEFKDTWRELLRKGYRPIDIEGYQYENRAFLGAIWIKDRSVSWVSYDALDFKEFNLVTEEARSNNQTPVDINAYLYRNKIHFSAIFAENKESTPWILEERLPYENFLSHTQKMYQKGYSLIDSSLYSLDGKQFYAAVWREDGKEWKLVNGLDEVGLKELIKLNQLNGYFVKDLEVKRTQDGLRYTALFKEAPVPDANAKSFFKLF